MNWIKDFIPTMKRNISQTFGNDKDSKIPEGLWKSCDNCGSILYIPELKKNSGSISAPPTKATVSKVRCPGLATSTTTCSTARSRSSEASSRGFCKAAIHLRRTAGSSCCWVTPLVSHCRPHLISSEWYKGLGSRGAVLCDGVGAKGWQTRV